MRVLGIDIGSSSIKAVEVDSAFGRIEIHEYHEQPILPDVPVSESLSQLLQKLPKRPDKIALSYSTDKTTFRNLLIPTRDRKAIRARVAFELEDELPFSMEDCTYDYVILDQSLQGAHVHIESTLTKNAQDLLDRVKLAGIDPDALISEVWAWRTLFNRIQPIETQRKPRLLIHIGQERTLLYLQWKGMPIIAREMSWGKNQMVAIQAPETSPEYSTQLLLAIQPLCTEIRQIRFSSQSLTEHPPEIIYLSGGAAVTPGLLETLQNETHIPAQIFRPLSSLAAGLTYTEHTDVVFGPALAVSLCLATSNSRNPSINFRKGALAKQSTGPKVELKLLKKPMIAAASVLTTLILSLTIQGAVYKSRLVDMDAQLEKSIRFFFGQIASSAVRTYISSPTTLKNSIQKEINKQRELAQLYSTNDRSPLEFIRTLSASISKDIVVDMTKIQVGSATEVPYAPDLEHAASLTFVVSNPQVAEKLSHLMSEKMPELKRGTIEEVRSDDEGIKRWKITFNGKTSEQNYGK